MNNCFNLYILKIMQVSLTNIHIISIKYQLFRSIAVRLDRFVKILNLQSNLIGTTSFLKDQIRQKFYARSDEENFFT